jgi:hypothetical protein
MDRSDALGRSVAAMMARGMTAAETRLIHLEMAGCLNITPAVPGASALFVWPPKAAR